MVVAKTLKTALGRRTCHEGHSSNCAACAQRRLQVQQQLGASTKTQTPRPSTENSPYSFHDYGKLRPKRSWVKVTRLKPFATKPLRISAAVVRLAL